MAEVLQFPAPPSDAAARTSALDTKASWIVEAPAGSGKTGLLMQRYLKLLTEDGVVQPEEVLAITFTRKATAELRARILTELEKAHHETPLRDENSTFERETRELAQTVLARDAALGWELIENPQRLRVRTIDSVCAEIASTLPLLSGSGGSRTPVEDAEPLYRLAARRTLMQLGGSDAALHTALRTILLHRDGSLSDCETLLARMLAAREQWGELIPLDRESLDDAALDREVRPRLESALENIVCAGLTRATKVMPAGLLQELAALASRLGMQPGYNDGPSPISFCAGLEGPPETKAEHLDHWVALVHLLLTQKDWRKSRGITDRNLGFMLPKYEKEQLVQLIESIQNDRLLEALHALRALPPARYPDGQWEVAKALFRLLLHALAELKVLFAERGECDFAELALAAREALRADEGPADLAGSSGATLRHLLVDEMQDTSSSQYELIELLTRSWDGHSQTLFLVGDPKQSIYLFRQARVERFMRTMQEASLGDVPVGVLRLTSNFRSQATLVEDFNGDFSRIFPGADATLSSEAIDVPFVAATAVRQKTESEGIVWHTAILGEEEGGEEMESAPTNNPRNDHALLEARRIRQIVEHWQQKPLPEGRTQPWRIAVLARARRHLAPIVAEFQRSDAEHSPIPFRAVKVEALDERPEVLDALALTRALLHPADRVAWLAVLHAPWCGLGIADLLALTGEGSSPAASDTVPALIEARESYLSDEGRALLARAWPILRTALGESGRGDIAVRIERTWRSLGGDVLLQPEQRTNVQHSFALLRELEQPGGWIDLRALKTRLEKLFAEAVSGEVAVELMTIHTAKGLEWDVVIVPALEKRGQTSRSDLLNWLELDGDDVTGPSIVLAPIYGKGSDPDELYKWLNHIRNAREEAERKRLYYVACTRAREELHLFATCERTSKGEVKPPIGTLLYSCWPAAQKHFDAWLEAPPSNLEEQLKQSLGADESSEGIVPAVTPGAPQVSGPPLIHRLPLTFNPLQRFAEAAEQRLPYLSASALRQTPNFERPEGSFAVRAFGNVVHRFLQVLATRLASGTTTDELLAELGSWEPRLLASLRGEGLAPALCQREASRALQALVQTLSDDIGRWILMPQPTAVSERAFTFAAAESPTLRVDRTFPGGTTPLSVGSEALWIVDFKTTEQGSRSAERFAEDERAKYSPQMESYAAVCRLLTDADRQIMLGLYYPLIPRLIHWPT
ncbi:exodeoxyribonuclease V subunit beta [Granulicella mallensis]|uniref:DNA 3'-5' helicase n=1 Tax=Granulicella mallensis TaxID=940614 RepID=A0A7W7ZSS4_9BACT|nr:UvrD-helicase domain-containing protein [Granulicella mallensis]MBB5065482.1 ATP-dependent exoDNAse (exonuclease V) beta subunit [Granulicella mallensis]